MLRELVNAAAWFDQRTELKVVIVSGAGRAFSAGADLEAFLGLDRDALRESADLGRQMAEAVERMRAVTIACIHGWCVGGGLVLAAACDLRFAAGDARFSIPELDLGIPLAWGGIPRLVSEIGPARTRELVLTCRVFDATEARDAGFINRVETTDELERSSRKLAEALAAKASLVLRATKRHVNAVTQQMVGTARSWSDADSLLAALDDSECAAIRERYLASMARAGGQGRK
jgi:enoyl-CoA hydratase/carnithine racemase